jgi:hypothetical protein
MQSLELMRRGKRKLDVDEQVGLVKCGRYSSIYLAILTLGTMPL